MAGNKYIYNNAGVLTEQASVNASAGSTDANKIVALDTAGRLDLTMMPTGIGPDTQVIAASENLSAGNLVNIWNNVGAFSVRKADATAAGKEAHGFVLASVTSGNNATVYFEGTVTGLTGLTPGKQYLATTPGASIATAPSTAGNAVQVVGFATSASTLNFQSNLPIILA